MQPFSPPTNPLELPAPPLQPRQGYCPLWNGLGTCEVKFTLLENAVHWYGVHFVADRPTPCMAACGRCAPCAEGWRPRRTGYVCAMRCPTGGRWILRITDQAYRVCPILALADGLRGFSLWVARRGDAKQSPWKLRPCIDNKPAVELPPSADTITIMGMIWGVDLRRLAQMPPADGDITPHLKAYIPRGKRSHT